MAGNIRSETVGARRRRLLSETSLLGLNTSQLANVLHALHGMPEDDREFLIMKQPATEKLKAKAIGRAIHSLLGSVVETMSVPPISGGADISLPFVNPIKLWDVLFREGCEGYCRLLRLLPRSSESKPWQIIAYGDEIIPGNVLRLDNNRKTFCIYFTVKEFGPSALHHVSAWFPWCMVRANVYKEIAGGMSTVWCKLLRHLFIVMGAGHGVMTANLGKVYLSMGNILADGAAIAQTFQFFAAGALLPCTCLNVFQGALRGMRTSPRPGVCVSSGEGGDAA